MQRYEKAYGLIKNSRLKPDDFNVLKAIGKGSFGEVYLVRGNVAIIMIIFWSNFGYFLLQLNLITKSMQ